MRLANGDLVEAPTRCPQTPVKREAIDPAVWTFFEKVVLDVDATRPAIAAGHEAKINEFCALRDQAGHEADLAASRLSRVRRDYQDGNSVLTTGSTSATN